MSFEREGARENKMVLELKVIAYVEKRLYLNCNQTQTN